MHNPRIISAEIVKTILEEKVFFSAMKAQIPEKHRAFINALVLSSLRNLIALKKIMAKYVRKKIPHKHTIAEYLLLLAINEILCMNTAPYAVINETVKNIRLKTDGFLAGMANAVLRKISANAEAERTFLQKTSKLSDDFLLLLRESAYSEAEIQALSDTLTDIPPTDLSIKGILSEWSEKLHGEIMPNGSIRLQFPEKIEALEGYLQGEWWIQDVSASLAVQTLGELKNKLVVDLCAAPGGKTAQLLAAGANVTALDISENRLNTLKENMKRLGFNDNVNIINADAQNFLRHNTKEFDVVLLDAPCSATGTLRRHPEIIHIKSQTDVNAQSLLQKELLHSAAGAVKKGGFLLYCVCSLSRFEGEWQIQTFLENHSEYKIVPISAKTISQYGSWENNPILENGTVRTMPFYEKKRGGMDGFFISLMQRIY